MITIKMFIFVNITFENIASKIFSIFNDTKFCLLYTLLSKTFVLKQINSIYYEKP